MTHKINHYILFLGVSLFFSCGNPPTVNLDGLVDIDVSIDEGENNAFTALIDDIRYVPLETSDEVLLGEILKIIHYNSEYYVADKSVSGGSINGIYRFDSDGRFLNRIGIRGRGPGEYIDPADFIVNSSGVIVLNHRQLLFFDHNGKYKTAITHGFILREITGMKDENMIFAVTGDNRHRKEAKDYETLIMDTEGNIISTELPNKYRMNFRYLFKSFLYDNKIIYFRPFHNIIYGMDQNGIVGKYCITLRDSPLPANYEKDCNGNYERFMKNYESKYNYFVGNLLENDDIVFFITEDKERMNYWNVYYKRTQEVKTGLISLTKILPPCFNAESVILLGLSTYLGTYEKDVIGYLNVSDLSVDDFSTKYPALAGIESDSNPVIFHFKFRE